MDPTPQPRSRRPVVVAASVAAALFLGLVLFLVLTRDGGDDGSTLGPRQGSTSGLGPRRASPSPSPASTRPGAVTSCDQNKGRVAGKPTYPAAPAMMIDVSKSYEATLDTSMGRVVVRLFPDRAPATVNSFVFLARCGFYDGTIFHRVVKDFVIQGGDPTGTGTGDAGYELPDELPPEPGYAVGAVAMANAGPNTSGSQFFVVTGSGGERLPNNYSLFGEVVEGQDVAKAIEQVPARPERDGKPQQKVTLERVTIEER